MKRLLLIAAAALLPLAAPAWDAAGHMLVDQIAWAHTKPAAREKVSALVASLASTFNEGQPYHFVTAGCWMDDMRAQKGYAWSQWHYVDIAFTPSGSPCAIPAEGPNIVWAIDENLKTLRNKEATAAQQTEAVAMLMHFVGDIHQPLHCTDWNDRGGNGYLIHGVPFTDLFGKSPPNLHTLWDKAFLFDARDKAIVQMWESPKIAERPQSPEQGIIAEQAAKIMAAFPPAALPELSRANTAANWACESHAIGCLAAYPLGPHPGDHEVVEMNPEFVRRAQQVAQLHVALAGYRLAALLNDLFAPESPAGGR